MIAPPYAAPREGRKRWGCARLVGIATAAGALWLGWQIGTWPDVAALADEPPETTAFIERWRRGGWLGLGPEREVAWTWVPGSRISRNLKHAVVVAEDIEFFSHDGFSRRELRAALEKALEERTVPRGASTITQQLAKNLWLSPSRNPLRKGKEALLTWQLERALSKRRILELYLNVVEFGPGVYGAGAASQRYFGKAPADLDESEAAQLAAALPNPAAWHPGVSSAAYRRHVANVERRMSRAVFLLKQI